MNIDSNVLNDYFDIELQFDFSGLNLQVFSGDILINDYFNIDGNFAMRLCEYKDYIAKGPLIIRTAKRIKFGVGNVYQEIKPEKKNLQLELVNTLVVTKERIF